MVGHVAPEAYFGGPIAAFEDGDIVTVDIPNRTIELALSDAKLDERLEDWEPTTYGTIPRAIQKYRSLFDSAKRGAVTRPLHEFE